MANPYTVGCDTRISNEMMFEGDPGSIYIVSCPGSCSSSTNSIHGSGIYDVESPICMAAIHGGVITDRGGLVTVKITWPMKSYASTKSNNIMSLEKGWSPKSFVPTKTIPFHEYLSVQNYPVKRRGLFTPFHQEPVNSNKARNPTSFLSFSSKMTSFKQKFKAYLHQVSFMEEGEDNKPQFVYASDTDTVFNE